MSAAISSNTEELHRPLPLRHRQLNGHTYYIRARDLIKLDLSTSLGFNFGLDALGEIVKDGRNVWTVA